MTSDDQRPVIHDAGVAADLGSIYPCWYDQTDKHQHGDATQAKQNGFHAVYRHANAVNVESPIHLMVKAEGDNYEFSYAFGEGEYVNVGGTVSGDILSTDIAGGFTGAMIGLYATSGNVSLPESD